MKSGRPWEWVVGLLVVGVGAVVTLTVAFASQASPSQPSGNLTDHATSTRTLACDQNMGSGTEPNSPGTFTVGPVGLLGVVASKPLTLMRLNDGVLWFKSYIVIPNSRAHRVIVSVRSLDGGRIGLDWGTQEMSSAPLPPYTPVSSLKTSSLSLPLCDGTSAGFPGGFVMTKPLCAQITVSAGKVKRSDRLSFGGAPCPA